MTNYAFLKLRDYPACIAQLQDRLSGADKHIDVLTEAVKFFEADIVWEIAFDTNLKNDAQRKARESKLKLQLRSTNQPYQETLELLDHLKQNRSLLCIELELRRNEFLVLKLEKREIIARFEAEGTSLS